MNWIIKQ